MRHAVGERHFDFALLGGAHVAAGCMMPNVLLCSVKARRPAVKIQQCSFQGTVQSVASSVI